MKYINRNNWQWGTLGTIRKHIHNKCKIIANAFYLKSILPSLKRMHLIQLDKHKRFKVFFTPFPGAVTFKILQFESDDDYNPIINWSWWLWLKSFPSITILRQLVCSNEILIVNVVVLCTNISHVNMLGEYQNVIFY